MVTMSNLSKKKEKNKITVAIVDDEPITRMDLREILQDAGYVVVAEASDGFDAIEICKKHRPDVVMLDIKLPHLDGLTAAKAIIKDNLADTVIMLTAYSDKNFINEAKETGVAGYLVKPFDERSLIPSIEVLVERSREFQRIRREAEKAEQKLQERTVVERAKGVIMKARGISEEQAYVYIRTLSQNKSLPMKEIAELILSRSNTVQWQE